MEQLVTRIGNAPAVPTEIDIDFAFDLDQKTFDGLQRIFNQLCDLTDIIGKDYDLSRLRELVQADREGRCVVLPVKPGGLVRFAGNPKTKHEKVDAINIYADGKITFSFHETGMKTRYVDEWSEDESEKYVSVAFDEAALKEREKDES